MGKIVELHDLYRKEGILTPLTLGRLADEAVETCAILKKPRLTTLKWAETCFENYQMTFGPHHSNTKKASQWVDNCKKQSRYNKWLDEVLREQGIAF